MKVYSGAQVQRIEQLETSAAVLTEVLAINTALSDLQARVSRVAEMLATTKVILPHGGNLDEILSVVDREMAAPANLAREKNRTETSSAPQAEGKVAKSAFVVPKSPTYERALDAYAESTDSASAIGKRVGILSSTVRAYLSMGRKVDDPRVIKGDAARQSPPALPATTQEEDTGAVDVAETAIGNVEEPTEPETAQSSTPTAHLAPRPAISNGRHVEPDRQLKPEPNVPSRLRLPNAPAATLQVQTIAPVVEEHQRTPVADFDPDKIVVVDVTGPRLFGPCGDLNVTRPFALTVARMADGGLYDAVTLRDVGAWPTAEGMRTHFMFMAPKLKNIGVELVTVSKEMFKLRRLEV